LAERQLYRIDILDIDVVVMRSHSSTLRASGANRHNVSIVYQDVYLTVRVDDLLYQASGRHLIRYFDRHKQTPFRHWPECPSQSRQDDPYAAFPERPLRPAFASWRAVPSMRLLLAPVMTTIFVQCSCSWLSFVEASAASQ